MLKLGLLNPLQKPNKAKGPAENLRPIILLSVLRKTLAITMINRIWNMKYIRLEYVYALSVESIELYNSLVES